jgi:hypothetical protein
VAAGDSAANMTLSGSGVRVVLRWVARATGTLSALHLRIQADGSTCRRSGRTGYGAGDGGSWLATTHPVLPGGAPDTTRTLAEHALRPCRGPASVVDVRQGVVRLPMRLPVRRGEERATVVRNPDPMPSENFTSTNFLFTEAGLRGANARNERSSAARDSLYGLDPRELVGYSSDGGRTWALPGGQYGRPGGRNFLPTYVQEFADGRVAGQPYYYAPEPARTDRTMVFAPARSRWVVRALGAYTGHSGTGELVLTVDGRERGRVRVSGRGMLRAAIDPVRVERGETVRVRATGLSLRDIAADTVWGRLLGMHTPASPWRVEGERDFSHAVPVYPLPAPPTAVAVRPDDA